MRTLTIKNKYQTNATLISNDFIDKYMIKANGEFVKVYLFLLRHLDDPCSSLTISSIADYLGDTERDVLRAFRYWEEVGLLTLEKDAQGNIVGLALEKQPLLPASAAEPPVSAVPVSADSAAAPATVTSVKQDAAHTRLAGAPTASKAIPLGPFKAQRAQKELKNLFLIAEQYLGKTLSHTDMETITYFYDGLGLSSDLIDYLLATCAENGHKSMHYIKKVAISWADNKITTVEEAKASSTAYNKNCYTVLNAFGIKGRGPAPAEVNFINRWTQDYGFTLDIVKEACDRTIAAIHQPSFEYADTILKRWADNGVHHLTDLSVLDQAHQNKQKKEQKTHSSSNSFNNFEGRSYDMDSLEEQLLKSN